MGNIWELSMKDLMKDAKTIETPYAYKEPTAIDKQFGDRFAKGKTTTFYGSNPNDPSTVRIYRGWPLMTAENTLSGKKAFKKNALKNRLNRIYDESTQKFKTHPNFRGPLTGQYWTNQPSTAYSMAGKGMRQGGLSWMYVKPKTLKNWWMKRPMEGHVYVPPTNVIQSRAHHIPIGVPAKDFSQDLANKVRVAKDYKQKSSIGKAWTDFKNWVRPNIKATAGAGVAMGSNPMHSSKIKGLGSALDDPSNFYLNVNTGGLASLVV